MHLNGARSRKYAMLETFLLLFLSMVSLLGFPTTKAEEDKQYLAHLCPNTPVFTPNSTFQTNLKLLLVSLSSGTSTSGGFYNNTIGESSVDKVYGLALCRGDVNSTVCQSCVSDASQEISTTCNSTQAIIWYELCQVHYSNTPFFSLMLYAGQYPKKNKEEKNVTDPKLFDDVLKNLMTKLLDQTAYTSKLMFATGDIKHKGNKSIYGLQQCTRDISGSDCHQCLESALAEIQKCCSALQGGTVVSRNCNIRFELYRFFDNIYSKGDKRKSWKVVVISVTILSVTFIVLCAVYLQRWRGRELENLQDEEISQHGLLPEFEMLNSPTGVTIIEQNKMVNSGELPFIDLATIRKATDDFSDSNKLGQGEFGAVYKGWLDGKEVAVKRLSIKSSQGLEEFRNEVTLIAKLQHRNLVRLLACGFEGGEKLLLYEFMPNFIFDVERRAELNWQAYHNIIGGIARGLLYLHEDSRLKIIHRDLNPNNVLLDHEMVPKISDFGMARIFCENQNIANTKKVVGTHGYMAPEYAMEGLFSIKSDVFSFGVVLLEILSGKKNSGFYLTEHAKTLVEYAWTLWKNGKGSEFVEPLLMEHCPKAEVLKYLQIALLCVQEDPEERPTMSAVVVLLGNDDSIGLPEPKKPAIFAIRRGAPINKPIDTGDPTSNQLTLSIISPR